VRESRQGSDSAAASIFEFAEDDAVDSSSRAESRESSLVFGPLPDAELRIPTDWKTISRVLDILLWYPEKRKHQERAARRKSKRRSKGKKSIVIESEEDISEDNEALKKIDEEYIAIFEDGEQPPEDLTEMLEEFEARTGQSLQIQHIDHVIWIFAKWEVLGYAEGYWLFTHQSRY
jgi:hypothetical protein